MTELLIFVSIAIIVCIVASKFLYRFGVPSLLIFMALGMVFGSDGLFKIHFDNYNLTADIATVGLIFIMFYGGFGMKIRKAKPVALQAIVMSSAGTVVTALVTGLFCHLALGTGILEGMLLGSLVSSTDAASVFSILRSRKLGLKNGLDSFLELESGSNDPTAYLLTVIFMTLIQTGNAGSAVSLLFTQLVFGIAIGLVFGFLTAYILKKNILHVSGFYPIITFAFVALAYGLCIILDGNGFLCVYIMGIILGNSKILHKHTIYQFSDGLSWLMQIMLFFLLGLLAFPSQMPEVILPGLFIALFLLLIARPLATFGLMSWFKVPAKSQLFISWVGFRGAASIVFAIFVLNSSLEMKYDLYHIVFFIALFSVLIQGSLTPSVAKKLDLVETTNPNAVLQTFNNYEEGTYTKLLNYTVTEDSFLAGKALVDLNFPEGTLIVTITRNNKTIIPSGSSKLYIGDILLLSSNNFDDFYSYVENE